MGLTESCVKIATLACGYGGSVGALISMGNLEMGLPEEELLPSGRCLSYANPRIGENRFGGEAVTYMGVGQTKEWKRIETFDGKLVENIT